MLVFVACCDALAIQYRLNFSSENWCLILVEQARLQPSASVLWWLCDFTGRGTRKSVPRSPFEGSCHAGSVYSARHCVVLDRSLSLKSPHTHSLFHECLSYLFKDTLLKSFFSPAKRDLVFSINPVIFLLTFFAHQIIFAHDKVLLKVALKCATSQGRVYLLFHWVQSTSHSVENVVETFSPCHQSN